MVDAALSTVSKMEGGWTTAVVLIFAARFPISTPNLGHPVRSQRRKQLAPEWDMGNGVVDAGHRTPPSNSISGWVTVR